MPMDKVTRKRKYSKGENEIPPAKRNCRETNSDEIIGMSDTEGSLDDDEILSDLEDENPIESDTSESEISSDLEHNITANVIELSLFLDESVDIEIEIELSDTEGSIDDVEILSDLDDGSVDIEIEISDTEHSIDDVEVLSNLDDRSVDIEIEISDTEDSIDDVEILSNFDDETVDIEIEISDTEHSTDDVEILSDLDDEVLLENPIESDMSMINRSSNLEHNITANVIELSNSEQEGSECSCFCCEVEMGNVDPNAIYPMPSKCICVNCENARKNNIASNVLLTDCEEAFQISICDPTIQPSKSGSTYMDNRKKKRDNAKKQDFNKSCDNVDPVEEEEDNDESTPKKNKH